MDCQSQFVISLFGMVFFAGFGLSCLLVPPLGDRNGRKMIFVQCITLNLFIFVALLILPKDSETSMYLTIVLMLFAGLISGGRMTVGYCYMVEMAPEKYAGMMGTAWDISESLVYIILTTYYRYINKNWHYIIAFATLLNLIAIIIIVCFIPESPKWLYDQGKYSQCYNALNYMAKVNKKTLVKSRQLLVFTQNK